MSEGIRHYVPQFLLGNFASNPLAKKKQKTIFCFDKKSKNEYKPLIKKAAAEFDLYDTIIDKKRFTLEHDFFTPLETKWAHLIERIIKTGDIYWFDTNDRHHIVSFFAVQLVRTRNELNKLEQIVSDRKEWIRSLGEDPDEVMFYDPSKPHIEAVPTYSKDPDSNKRTFLSQIQTSLKDFGGHLLTKDIVLLRTSNKKSFYISDNPITLENNTPMSNDILANRLGLTAKGIELYCPISKDYTISLLCPSILNLNSENTAKDSHIRYGSLAKHDCTDANVDRLNLSQLQNAEKYLYSHEKLPEFYKACMEFDKNLEASPRMASLNHHDSS